MKFILGSGSPRRRMLLGELLPVFDVIVPRIDENRRGNEKPESYLTRILGDKMDFIVSNTHIPTRSVILVSDTIVTIDGIVLGKPFDRNEAFNMLARLSGRRHSVITGLKLRVADGKATLSYEGAEYTDVFFRELDYKAINLYLDITDYTDKAGAYAVQQNGDMIIEKVTGSITNVIGFPLRLFYKMLNEAGLMEIVLFSKDIPNYD